MAAEKDGQRLVSELDESTQQSVREMGSQLRQAGVERLADTKEISPPTPTPANAQPERQNERFRGRGMDDSAQRGYSLGRQEINARTESANWNDRQENAVTSDMDRISQKANEFVAKQQEAEKQKSDTQQHPETKDTQQQNITQEHHISHAEDYAHNESSKDESLDKAPSQRDKEQEAER